MRQPKQPMQRDPEKGAIRPLWLTMGVLTCVLAGSVVNRCLVCGAPESGKTTVVVRGELINAPLPETEAGAGPETKPDPSVEANPPAQPSEAQPARKKLRPLFDLDEDKDEAKKGGNKEYPELTFDTLADWTYEFPDLTAEGAVRPDPMPERFKKMSGNKYAIRGFMIPYKVDGEEVTEFLLVRNQFACCFGVVPKMNEWLHIKMAEGKRAPYAVDIPITVYGVLDAKELIEKGIVMSLYRMEATLVEEPEVFR